MKWFNSLKVSSKLLFGFGFVLLVFLAVIGISLSSLSGFINANQWNTHSYSVLDGTQNILSSLINIETGYRGYVIAGKDDFLEPVTQGAADFAKYFGEV